MGSENPPTGMLFTVGHSNRTIEEFLGLLTAHGIGLVVDVRRFPASRRYPHFEKTRLRAVLMQGGIDYLHIPELGGRRAPRRDSPNTGWKNAGFRGYADYMETIEFHKAISQLLPMARIQRTAIMCAEALWWQCHRSLIADHLKSAGFSVHHILSTGQSQEHPYTSAARIVDGRLSYRGDSLFDQPEHSAKSR